MGDDDEWNYPVLFRQLLEEISLLASPASDQDRWLADNRYPVDEMALQLEDSIFLCFPRLVDRGILTFAAREAVVAIDEFLGTFSGRENAALWTEEALGTRPEWARVRELAQTALERIDASPGVHGEVP